MGHFNYNGSGYLCKHAMTKYPWLCGMHFSLAMTYDCKWDRRYTRAHKVADCT